MEFLDCLPKAEKDRSLQMVIYHHYNFDQLAEMYFSSTSVVPGITLEVEWRKVVPSDRTGRSLDLWFSKWLTLASQVPHLTEQQMIEQFDGVMHKIVPGTIKKYFREDRVCRRRSLDEWWEVVQQEIFVRESLGHMDQA